MKPARNLLFLHRRPSRTVRGVCCFFLWACLSGGLAVCLSAGELPAAPSAALQPPGARPPRVFGEPDLLALLTTTLQRDYVKDRGDLEVVLTQPWPAVTLPDEPLTMKFLELPAAGIAPSFIVRFQLCTARETLGTWQVSAQAHLWRTVWVAHSNLRRGLPVNGADIVRERFDVLNVREALAAFATADDPNLELAEPVSSGVPLLARMIKLRAVIHRGQVANALVQDGMLSVTTKVEALEDGAPGQMIHARNSISRRDLSGRVLDNQTILISL